MIFHFTCVGNWIHEEVKLLLRKGSVNKMISEVCPTSFIKIATNSEWSFEIDHENDVMIEMEMSPGYSWDWEILDAFFKNYNFTPTFQDSNYTWGFFDEEINSWTGSVEMVCWPYLLLFVLLLLSYYEG